MILILLVVLPWVVYWYGGSIKRASVLSWTKNAMQDMLILNAYGCIHAKEPNTIKFG
jgi:hypothetical protein